MASTLLATKLHLPFLPPKRVQRPHLVQYLNEGLAAGRLLTLVSAPAGFGKSTCVGEWVNGLDLGSVSWLSLDPADNDPVRFFSYLVTALQKGDETIGRELESVLQAGQLPPVEYLITTLLNDILKIDRKIVLILDDFQVIRESKILKSLEMLINNEPRNMHLVLLTREDPQLPLARLRANNQLTEIRAGDLRFSNLEANRFFSEVMGLYLSDADIALLEERTEGWIVGLQLAGLSIRGREAPSNFIANLSGSHRYILSYLTEEVLNRQPEEVREFLVRTSILERLCAELCDEITKDDPGESSQDLRGGKTYGAEVKPLIQTGSSSFILHPSSLDSAFILDLLERSNLFVIPLDDVGQWYRYHHLFADLLQAQLRQTTPLDAILALHRSAAAWYERNGFTNEAVNHALAARDFDGAARLVEQNTYAMMTRGELTTLLQWIDALPEDVTSRRPLATLAKAWVLIFAGAVQQIEPLLLKAEANIAEEDVSPMALEVRGNAAAMRAFISIFTGDYERALELAERAEALLSESDLEDRSLAPFHLGARSILPYTTGTAYRGQGSYEKAAEAFEREVKMAEASENLFIWVNALVEVVNTRRVQGKLRQAGEICRRALLWIAERGLKPIGSLAKLDASLSEILREQNELEEAQSRVQNAIAGMQNWNMPSDQLFAACVLIHIQESQGDIAGAKETLAAVKILSATQLVSMTLVRSLELHEVRLHLASGDVAAAVGLIDRLHPGSSRMVFLREEEMIMLARVRLAQGRPDEAVNILDPFVRDPGAAERLWIWLEILALQAVAYQAQGNREAAVTLLIQALGLAEPEGFVRVFVDEGEAMYSLLSAAARQLAQAPGPIQTSLTAYIAKLLGAFQPGPASEAAIQSKGSAGVLIEPLTDRELEVLRLIAEGLKYEEMAHKLFISLNTVRTYVKAIYSKLNVNNRSKAIAQAHELKLI